MGTTVFATTTAPGPPGPTGPPGYAPVYIVAAGAPSNAIGNDHDMYIDSTNGNVYGPKVSGNWGAVVCNIKGSTGATGAQGIPGYSPVYIVAAGPPGAGVGNDHDMYINSTTSDVYGPKTSGTWGGIQCNIKGGTGSQGPPGVAYNPRGAWSSTTTYAQGDQVTSGNQLYISLQSGNLNHDPATSPTFWQAEGTGGVAQTPWLTDIDGAGYWLKNAGRIGVGNDATALPDSHTAASHLIVGSTTASNNGEITVCINSSASGISSGSLNFANYNLPVATRLIGCIYGMVVPTADSGELHFYTANAGSGADRMVISAAGNVGIGTAGPTQKLHLYSTVNDGADMLAQTTGDGAFISVQNGSSGAFKGYRGLASDGSMDFLIGHWGMSGHGMCFMSGPAEAMRITAAGNVGIGTTGPQTILHCYRSQAGVPTAITIDNDGGGVGTGQAVKFSYGASGILGGIYHQLNAGSQWVLRFTAWTNSAEAERMTINGATGNVGIGTTGPTTPLHLKSTTGATALTVETTTGSFAYTQYIVDNHQWQITAGGSVSGQSQNLYVYDVTHGAVRFLINDAGNVGIGTTAPSVKFQVQGKTYSTDGYWVDGGDLVNYVNGSTWYGLGKTTNGWGVQLAGYGGVHMQASGASLHLWPAGVTINTDMSASPNAGLACDMGSTTCSIRILGSSSYGTMHYIDAANYYILLTNAGDKYGNWNALRPFYIDLATGGVHMNNSLAVSGSFTVNGVAVGGGGVQVCTANGTQLTPTRSKLNFNSGSGTAAHIYDDIPNGYVTIYYDYISDLRLKKNIVDLTGGLPIINQLRPVSFQYNGLGGTTKDAYGVSLIAQEVKEVLPKCVTTYQEKLNPEDEERSDFLTFNPYEIIFHLVVAVKQLGQRVEALEQKVN